MDILIEELEESLWAAALQDGLLVGLEADPSLEEVRWGSIYWARIKSIDKALDAAFLDLDGFNTGILYNNDVRLTGAAGKIVKGGEKPIGKVFQPGDMVAVQAKSAYLSAEEDDYARRETKMPQMSMDITLPGRYMVFCPMVCENRISRRIRDKKMRSRLRKMLDEIDSLQGFILRMAAANTQTDVLLREGRIMQAMWKDISRHFEGQEAGLIALGPDAVERTLSDQAGRRIDRIEVVTMEHYKQVEEWCSIFAPDLVTKIQPVEIKHAEDDLALFHERDIIGQIESLFQSYTLLPGGGNLIIQNAAALTAIDVNQGGDKDSRLGINIQAAKEIARQLRLRNCGGIIVVDFLKMKDKEAEKKLISALEDAVNEDPCTVQIHGFTKLGLLEMTRKRRTPPLQDRFSSFIA